MKPIFAIIACHLLAFSLVHEGQAQGIEDVPAAASSAESNDPELDLLEEKYLTELTKARSDLGAQYLAALERLQESLTKSQAFDQALLVKQEAERVTEMISQRMESAQPLPSEPSYDPVVLLPADADLNGKISLSKANILYRWERGGSASWFLPGDMPPGTYEIIMNRSCSLGEGGVYTVSVGENVISGSIVGEGAWTDWAQVHVGDLEIESGTEEELKITASRVTSKSLMNVRQVIVAEKGTWERIQSGEDIETITSASNGKSTRKGGGLLQQFEGVILTNDDEHPLDGDSFHVNYKGDNYHLRLFWVDAPMDSGELTDADTRASVEEEAAYFGITPEASIKVGQAAAAYVKELLAGKNFSVLVGRRTSYSGKGESRKMAMLKVGNKYLSQLLVENGLVRIHGAQISAIPDGPTLTEYMDILNAAEEKAREQRKGAWGM